MKGSQTSVMPENTSESTPKCSIVLPVYNGEAFLRDCISSILEQTESQFELIIGDDHSKDNSSAIIGEFNDPRITHITHEYNLGLFDNLNFLAGVAHAPLLRFLGQDDRLKPNCIAEEIAFFEKNPSIRMTYCKATFIGPDDRTIGATPINDLPEIINPALANQLFFYFGCLPGNISTVCVRREAFIDAQGFDTNYDLAADYEMWVRLCQDSPLGIIHSCLIDLRLHENQLSHTKTTGGENMLAVRQVQARLRTIMGTSFDEQARHFSRWAHDVQDFHYGIRCLMKGYSSPMRMLAASEGWLEFVTIMMRWLISGNNHIYTPRPAVQS